MTDLNHRILQGIFYRALMTGYGYRGFDGPSLLRIIIAIIVADRCALQPSGSCGLRDLPVTVCQLGSFAVVDRDDALIAALQAGCP